MKRVAFGVAMFFLGTMFSSGSSEAEKASEALALLCKRHKEEIARAKKVHDAVLLKANAPRPSRADDMAGWAAYAENNTLWRMYRVFCE